MMKLCIHSIFVLLFKHSVGIFEIVPTEDVLLCPGERLEVICRTSDSSYLEWNLTIPHIGHSEIRTISSFNRVGKVSPFKVAFVGFMFTITAKEPLTSKLSVNSTTANLNGTIVMCTEKGTASDRSADIILHVKDTTIGDPIPPWVHIIDELFGTVNVTVFLEWIGSGNAVSYNVGLTPEMPSKALFHRSTQLELVLLYNILYNLTVTATLCGESNATTTTDLHYVNCGEPVATTAVSLEYNSTLLGSRLLYWCRNGLHYRDLPKNFITAQCTENAVWIPNPTNHSCSASSEFTTLMATMSTDHKETNVSKTNLTLVGIGISMTVVALLIAFVAIVTLVAITKASSCGQTNTNGEVEYQEKNIEMSKNIVYDHINYWKQRVLTENISYCSSLEFYSPN